MRKFLLVSVLLCGCGQRPHDQSGRRIDYKYVIIVNKNGHYTDEREACYYADDVTYVGPWAEFIDKSSGWRMKVSGDVQVYGPK